MRNALAVVETTEERRQRINEELEQQRAMVRMVKRLCLWIGGGQRYSGCCDGHQGKGAADDALRGLRDAGIQAQQMRRKFL